MSYPANTIALGKTCKAVPPSRKFADYNAQAEAMMADLRERGFRLVPIVPLKVLKRRKAARKGAAKRAKVVI